MYIPESLSSSSSSAHFMDNDSSAKTHIIPLASIVIILVIILCTRSPVISPHADHATGQTGRPLRPEPGIPEEEEPLLSFVEAQNTLPREDSQLQNAGDTLAHLSAEIDQWKDADARKAEDIKVARLGIAKLQQELSTSVSQNVELQRRCETLSRDLEAARLFLNTADTFADSEVIQMLQKLNAELQHISTFMADRVLSVFKLGVVTPDPEQQIMVDGASEIIGSTFVQFLRTPGRDDSEVPMYLQIAFQAYLTHQLCQIVSSWTLDEGRSAFLNEIYQRLRETEKQTISGRWRSLTRLYTLPTCVDESNSPVTPIIAGLSHVLLAVGCSATQSNVMSELSSMFAKKILSAVTLAGRLSKMIGEVVSGDFEVFVARPGDTFYGGTMEEDIDDDDDVQRAPDGTRTAQTVLCTSELGLTKRIQLGTGERETTTVIKAKVILESFLHSEN